MPNGEHVKRDWLVYSKTLDAVCCFCCRVFGNNIIDVGISSSKGFRDWFHMSRTVKLHEQSSSHLDSYLQWKSLVQRISDEKTIENKLFNQFQKEKERLREVFKRLIAFILYFARQNIALTGSSYNIHDPAGHNGNFQQLIHTCATFDPVLKEHLEKHDKVHYMSPKIQNELISIIGSKVRTRILECIKQSKYYAIILDGTTDVTHIEQMCLVLRYVHLDKVNNEWAINERFIKFSDISSAKTGLLISNAALTELESLNLDSDDMRGQGLDNGAPMIGKNIGVQKRIRDQNPRAFFNPCGNHSLNLVVNDAADCSKVATEFFARVQKIFVFLSASTSRWDILKNHLAPAKATTPKPLCTTRWSSRIDAMKPLCKNPGEITAALRKIEDTDSFKPDVRFEAGSLADKIDYSFICCACFWYDILSQTNIASKALQSIKSNIQAALISVESVTNFLLNYEQDSCDIFQKAADICESISIESKFESQKRPAARTTVTSEDEFRANVIMPVIKSAVDSITDRFKALQKYNELFSFLYDFANYETNRRSGSLLQSCKKLEIALTHNGNSDIDGDDLFAELAVVSTLINNENIAHIIDVLNAIQKKNMQNIVPNFVIALRILLTIPVSVASGERSFSKLKLIKTFLRNSMGQERLSDLAIISIENDVANAIEYDDVIEDFATAKARKKSLF